MVLSAQMQKHLLWFVTGAVHIYFDDLKYSLDKTEFKNYVETTLKIVTDFLEKKIVLDKSYSSNHLNIAYEAERMFKTKLPESQDAIPDWTIHDRRKVVKPSVSPLARPNIIPASSASLSLSLAPLDTNKNFSFERQYDNKKR